MMRGCHHLSEMSKYSFNDAVVLMKSETCEFTSAELVSNVLHMDTQLFCCIS